MKNIILLIDNFDLFLEKKIYINLLVYNEFICYKRSKSKSTISNLDFITKIIKKFLKNNEKN